MKQEIKNTYEKNYFNTIEEIKTRMDAFGITQSYLAETLGITTPSINRIFQRKTIPNVITFVAIINTINTLTEQAEKLIKEKLTKNQTNIFDKK